MKKKVLFPLLLTLTLFTGCQRSNSSSIVTSNDTSDKPTSHVGQNLTGEGEPDPELGEDGDTYQDLVSGNYYEKEDGQWVLVREGTNQVYEVTFDLNGGHFPDGSTSYPTQKVADGRWVKAPTYDPIKSHSTFLGWYTDRNNLSSRWSFQNPVYGNMVLTALYSVNEEEKVVITVNPNNGEPTYTVETFVGDTPSLKNPTKNGYAFVGWFIQGTDTRFTTVQDGMDGVVIEARFEKAKFNLLYTVGEDEKITITGVLNRELAEIVVPDHINGREVVAIGERAFQSYPEIVSITLPSTVKTIAPSAFNDSGKLQNIYVDDTNPYFLDEDGILFTKDKYTIVRYAPKRDKSYTLPQGVKYIGDYAFYGFKDSCVSDIIFNNELEEIGNYAFAGNENLVSLNFPSSLRRIGKSAFNCYSAEGYLQNVNFNEGLEYIGDSAFAGAYFKDNQPVLPSTLKEIGGYAFANCTAIKTLTLPKGLETLGENVFAGCTGILEVKLASGNTHFALYDNIIYDYNMTKVVFCPSGRTEKVVIPNNVTEIGDYAFYMCDELKEYEFPTTLKRIGVKAFAQCYHLNNFVIPDSVIELGHDAFETCNDLSSITIGTGLQTIPEYAFADCYSLTSVTIPGNVKKIDSHAFYGCSGIKELHFNEGLQEIGSYAFHFSTSAGGEGDDSYNSGAVAALDTITLPNSLLTLADEAFSNQGALKTVNFGTGLQTIGLNVFGDTSVTTINVPEQNNNFKFENKVLYDKTQTTIYFAVNGITGTYEMPNTVTEVKDFAFYKKGTISDITFSDKLQTIGEGAFGYTHDAEVAIPASCRTIKAGAFAYGFIKTLTFAEGVESIGESAFFGNEFEGTITLPNSLKGIGAQAFASNRKLSGLTLGTGLTSIGAQAFASDIALTSSVTLPATLTYFGEGAFASTQFKEIKSNSTSFTVQDGVVYDKDNKVLAYENGNEERKTVTLKEETTAIAAYAFCGAQFIESLKLNSSLTSIGEEAFSGCYSITSISIPASVNYIGRRAFRDWGRTNNQSITLNCSEDDALMLFDQFFLSDTRSNNVTVKYVAPSAE